MSTASPLASTTMAVDTSDAPRPADTTSAPGLSPKERMDKFEQIILGDKQTFALGGTVPLTELNPADLAMYYSANMQDSHILRFPATQDDLSKCYEEASPSPFGVKEEKVFDDTYRQAREFKPPNFALSHDLVLQPKILSILTANLAGEGQIAATVNKVNVYATGGFFKEHRDTPLGRNHIGTLTFCLPSTFTGGELVVTHDGIEVVFDWSKSKGAKLESAPPGHETMMVSTSNSPISDVSITSPITSTPILNPESDAVTSNSVDTPTPAAGLITWAFLYADVCHQVLPVTSGTRLTVAYDIWRFSTQAPLMSKQIDVTANTVLDYFISLLGDDKTFMPNGGRLAFGTSHAYPVDRSDQCVSHLIGSLKGKDAALVAIILKLGLSAKIRAVYQPEYDDDSNSDRSEQTNISTEAVDRSIISVQSVGRRHTLYTGSDFWPVDGEYYGEDFDYKRDCNVSSDEDVIWVTEPGGYGHTNSYVTHGNEPCAETMYIGVALFVSIPPAAERERFQAML